MPQFDHPHDRYGNKEQLSLSLRSNGAISAFNRDDLCYDCQCQLFEYKRSIMANNSNNALTGENRTSTTVLPTDYHQNVNELECVYYDMLNGNGDCTIKRSSTVSSLVNVRKSLSSACRHFLSSFFSYSTGRQETVPSLKIAVIFRIFQFIILTYVIGWDILYKKGYQLVDDEGIHTVTTKVKGLGYLKQSADGKRTTSFVHQDGRVIINTDIDGTNFRIFDTADYVIPASEYNSVFVMTNFFETIQSQGLCEENFRKVDQEDFGCKTNSDCSKKFLTNVWNGFPTGRCIKSRVNSSIRVCEISGWCPVMAEDKHSRDNIIQNVEAFTLFIKSDIKFKKLDKTEQNMKKSASNQYIAECAYMRKRSPECPVFLIRDILEKAEPDQKQRSQMLMRGGIIEIMISWNCDYDRFSDQCVLNYDFQRSDFKFSEGNLSNSIVSGFNLKTSHNYLVNGVMYRTLVKAYGLKFVIVVTGRAGKFNIVPLLIKIGSGIGLLSIATIIADLTIMFFYKAKPKYQDYTNLNLSDLDRETVL